jgi:hypothetical protein
MGCAPSASVHTAPPDPKDSGGGRARAPAPSAGDASTCSVSLAGEPDAALLAGPGDLGLVCPREVRRLVARAARTRLPRPHSASSLLRSSSTASRSGLRRQSSFGKVSSKDLRAAGDSREGAPLPDVSTALSLVPQELLAHPGTARLLASFLLTADLSAAQGAPACVRARAFARHAATLVCLCRPRGVWYQMPAHQTSSCVELNLVRWCTHMPPCCRFPHTHTPRQAVQSHRATWVSWGAPACHRPLPPSSTSAAGLFSGTFRWRVAWRLPPPGLPPLAFPAAPPRPQSEGRPCCQTMMPVTGAVAAAALAPLPAASWLQPAAHGAVPSASGECGPCRVLAA